jgi:hypothetical protein
MLEKIGAGEGNRTLVISLEGFCSTIELHPRRAPRRVARIQHLGLGQNTAAPADDIIEKNIGNAPLCAGARVRGTPCDLIHSGVALDALHAGIYRREVNWVRNADIQASLMPWPTRGLSASSNAVSRTSAYFGWSQIARSSSSSRHESRNCRQRHAGRSSSA